MITKEAIETLNSVEGTKVANHELGSALRSDGLVLVPSTHGLSDLESFLPQRRRMRGEMATTSHKDFCKYFKDHAEKEQSSIFINTQKMSAAGILNFSSNHADNTVRYNAIQTAAYKALLGINGSPMSQAAFAEFLEDWVLFVHSFEADGEPMDFGTALSAIRAITVESAKRVESAENNLSASRSAFESVQVKSAVNNPPTRFVFECAPYAGFDMHKIGMRVSYITQPTIKLIPRIVNLEELQEELGEEMANNITSQLEEIGMGEFDNIYFGEYTKRA